MIGHPYCIVELHATQLVMVFTSIHMGTYSNITINIDTKTYAKSYTKISIKHILTSYIIYQNIMKHMSKHRIAHINHHKEYIDHHKSYTKPT